MFQKFGKGIPQSLVDMVSGIMEAKVEPDAPDAEAIARKKRLQAIKDKQEDDAAERGTSEKKPSNVRVHKGTYGTSHKDDEMDESHDMDESGLRMAAHAAHKAGQKEFEFLGKKYPVKVTEDGKVDCNYAKVKDIAKKEVRGHEKAMHEQTIDERELSAGETKKKEHIVKSMKKNLSGFKSRYGDKAKSVMYATATKQAKKEEVDSSNEIVNSRQKQYNQAEEYELHLDLTEGEKMDGKKKVVKKESMMGAAPSNATGMGESRGHKIIADKLRQIASKSHGVSPDMSTTAQNIKDRLKDAKNLSRVEIVCLLYTSPSPRD